MKNRLLMTAMAAFALTTLPACSTIVNGSNQTINFDSGSVSGANCELTGGSKLSVNETFVTPAEVKVPRSKKALKLKCDKSGYQTLNKTIASKIESTTAGNLLLGGVIGAGVDAATGAIYKYPEVVTVVMERLGGS